MATKLEIKYRMYRGRRKPTLDLRKFGGGREKFDNDADAQKRLTEARDELGISGTLGDFPREKRLAWMLCETKLEKVGATIEEATEFYCRNAVTLESKTVADAIEEMTEDKRKKGCSPIYIRCMASTMKSLTELVGPRPCSDINRADIEAWIARDEWEAATKRQGLTYARLFFRYCIARGWSRLNPALSIQSPQANSKPPVILTIAECHRLFATLSKPHWADMRSYFALATFAGIRPEEVSRMTWDNVNLAESFAEVPAVKAKTRQRRIVTLHENAIAILKTCKRKAPFCPPNFKNKMMAVRKGSGVKWSHDILRHSFASYHLAAFGSADKTATQLGHSDTTMLFRHYRELVTPNDAKEFWKVGL